MSEKKHKGGYELLKEKLSKVEKERDELKQEIDRRQEEKEILVQTAQDNYIRMEKERDGWKAKWRQADAVKQDAVDNYNRLKVNYDDVLRALKIANQKMAFLLDHCPFWVRWMYRKHFEKGGKE